MEEDEAEEIVIISEVITCAAKSTASVIFCFGERWCCFVFYIFEKLKWKQRGKENAFIFLMVKNYALR